MWYLVKRSGRAAKRLTKSEKLSARKEQLQCLNGRRKYYEERKEKQEPLQMHQKAKTLKPPSY